MSETIQHPSWKHVLALMRVEVIQPGKIYKAEWFAENLREERDSLPFNLGISAIRRELEHDGFYLSGRGQNGDYVVLKGQENAAVMEGYQHAAMDAIRRAMILGTNTDTTDFTESETRRHESVLERAGKRMALLQIRRVRPKLPNGGSDSA